MQTLPLLSDLKKYTNDAVVQYYCKKYPEISLKNAQQIFNDLLEWMWLNCQRKENQVKTYMFGPLLNLDRMWHVFILHTRVYMAFCQIYFGGYFHHDIEPIGEEYQPSPDELYQFLNDCFDHLGEEWVLRNFGHVLEMESGEILSQAHSPS